MNGAVTGTTVSELIHQLAQLGPKGLAGPVEIEMRISGQQRTKYHLAFVRPLAGEHGGALLMLRPKYDLPGGER